MPPTAPPRRWAARRRVGFRAYGECAPTSPPQPTSSRIGRTGRPTDILTGGNHSIPIPAYYCRVRLIQWVLAPSRRAARPRFEPGRYPWNVTRGVGRQKTMVERRNFLMAGAMGSAAVLSGGVAGAQAHADPGPGHSHGHGSPDPDTPIPRTPPLEKYVDPLPTPETAVPDTSTYPGADYYEVTMRPGTWQFHRDLGRPTCGATGPRTRTIDTSRSAWAISGRPSA